VPQLGRDNGFRFDLARFIPLALLYLITIVEPTDIAPRLDAEGYCGHGNYGN
jgi:hypothetical protein